MFSIISASTGLAAWFSGAATGIGLFAVVGAQSAFILRQGILRKHIVPVVATCARALPLSPGDRAAVIGEIAVVAKDGGRSGSWRRP